MKTVLWRSLLFSLLLLSCSATQLSAFQAFYQSAGGSQWFNSTGWSDGVVCNFHGVSCTSDNQVVSISLAGNNLSGTIDPEWFTEITSIQKIDLSRNSLSGDVPNGFSGLSSLRELDLSENGFISVANLSSVPLQTLSVGNNPLSTSFLLLSVLLPPSLKMLNISFCQLYGPMDPLTSFRSIIRLDASNNGASSILSDASSLTYLTFVNFSSNSALGNLSAFSSNRNKIVGDLNSFSQLLSLEYLQLTSNLIHSTIPSFIGELDNITFIDIGLNEMYGYLPDNIAVHQKISILILSFTLLSGPFPYHWDMPSLFILSAGTCQFNGTIPPSMWRLPNLRVLVTAANQITGELPRDISTLPSLAEIYVTSNHHTGNLPQIYPPNLARLDADYNQFTGSLPVSLCGLRRLYEIDVTSNALDSSVPDCIGTMNSLVYLKLGYNQFTGFPSTFNLPLLSTLQLNNNLMSGNATRLFYFPNLKIMDISFNSFSGMIPNDVNGMTQLNELTITENLMSGVIPVTSFGKMTSLKKLVLSYNNLTGAVPCFGSSIQYLDVSRNSLTSLNVRCFQTSFSMTYLDISYNQISSSIPFGPASLNLQTLKMSNNLIFGWIVSGSSFREYLKGLTYLDVSNNLLSGSVSFGLSQCKHLQYVNLSRNSFTGFFPSIITPDLTSIDVSYNYLEGALPESWSKNLEYLSVSHNRFIGNISDVLGYTSLVELDLSHNMLSGYIPDTFQQLNKLNRIDLSRNRLRGDLHSIINLPSLTSIDLSDNDFSGSIDKIRSDPRYIDLSNNQLSGPVTWMSTLDAVQYLSIDNNSFSGAPTYLSKNVKLTHISLAHNALTGDLDLSRSTSLAFVSAPGNLFNGTVSIDSPSLLSIDLSGNRFHDADGLVIYNETAVCDLSGVLFECPIPWSVVKGCQVSQCVVSNSSSSSLRFHMRGEVSSFDQNAFLKSVSILSNSTLSRFGILKLTSGSVIADVTISPPPRESTNEGSASRVASLLIRSSNDLQLFSDNGVPLIDPISNVPSESPNGDKLGTGGIVGIAVGCTLVVVIIVIVAAIVIHRRNQMRLQQNKMVSIDLSQINLGAAKKSIVDHTELKDLSLVGSGAYGVVYRAKWRDIPVAVKQIKAEFITEEQLRSFLGEVAILQSLRSHPNVVLFMGATFPPQPLSMITEFCKGGGLYEYLRRNECSWEVKLSFIQGIALGMLHLHLEKVIHRDLAVRNILLTEHLVPKVSDFGMSREQKTDDASTTQTMVGPLKWMSPEAIQKGEYSPKSDVFSFAVVMWEIITVEEPWAGLSGFDAAVGVIQRGDRMRIPETCDYALADLIQQCWHVDPEQRPDFKNITRALSCDMDAPQTSEQITQEMRYSQI
ncbi:putative LRR receptor-like serine/threonine-protein kinase [Planoprotostelium fungivorum]|uniref:Putative LRR receptor-like serine/threonine-protein kinase n=1 Tax=Planoprotostelium fungivorum TaxID=1890364 RepID=A0A2P6NVB8_9EUKA|nr:putative LRR receptor-like serine/threonine-protein kinase [Planoprotostelium fungivorum]